MAIREELTLGIQNFQANLDRARSDVRKTAGEMSRDMRNVGGGPGGAGGGMMGMLGGSLTAGIGTVVASLGGTTGVLMALKESLSVADDLADLTLALNESAEGLQRVDFAAQQAASIGVDQVAKSMMRLERSLGDVENVKATEALERLGLTASQLAGMSLEEKILALSEAFEKARLEGTGMADIQDLLGRSAADLVPLFAQGKEGIEAMFERAPVLAEAAVQEMARMNDELAAMMTKFNAMKAQSAAGLISLGKLVKDTFTDGFDQAVINRGAEIIGFQVDANIRESARKTQAENMEKAANAAKERAVIEDQGKQMENFDKAEAEANKDAERRRLAAAQQRARDEEAYEKSAFARLDPEAQMETLRDRMAKSLGIDALGSTAEIEAGAAALAKRGKFAEATDVLSDLGSLEAIAGRQGGTRAPTSAGQGSLATLMDEIFGRTPGELQLEESRRAAEAGEKTVTTLDQILKKMDEPPPRDTFTDNI
jgi:hypothetical protein